MQFTEGKKYILNLGNGSKCLIRITSLNANDSAYVEVLHSMSSNMSMGLTGTLSEISRKLSPYGSDNATFACLLKK